MGSALGRSAALDQSGGQPKFPAQVRLFALHFAIIALVIVTRQMKNSMQCQDSNFLGCGVTQASGILGCDLRRDGNFAREVPVLFRIARKGEYVGGSVLAAKTGVQRTQFAACGHQEIHAALETGGASRFQKEPR